MSHHFGMGSARLSEPHPQLTQPDRRTLPSTLVLLLVLFTALFTPSPHILAAPARIAAPPRRTDDSELLRSKSVSEHDMSLPGGRSTARGLHAEPTLPSILPKVFGEPDGGDDVQAFEAESIEQPSLAAADNGDLYMALAVEGLGPQNRYIQVLRSLDGGKTWEPWGILGDPSSTNRLTHPVILVPGGSHEACYVAYTFTTALGGSRIDLAKSPLGGSSASFTVASAFDDPAVDFDRVDLVTDVVDNDNYWIYLVAQGDDGNGQDIWFTRSINYGFSFVDSYRIAQLLLSDRNYSLPRIDYGHGARIHVAWDFAIDGAGDAAARYRNADDYASGGLGSWNPTVYLTSTGNGIHEDVVDVCASDVDDVVVYFYRRRDLTSVLDYGYLEVSRDRGDTWGTESPQVFEPAFMTDVFELPGGGWGVAMNNEHSFTTRWAPASLSFWTVYRDLADRDYYDGRSWQRAPCATTAAHPNDIAVAWCELDTSPASDPDRVWFDATWRNDPGYPNLEPGFPMPLTSGAYTDPAVIDLDHDSDLEIVYGDEAGYVQVLHHDGSPLAGWPQYVGTMDRRAAVAIGDLNGDDEMELIAATRSGMVFSFATDGSLSDGWPLDLGTGEAGFVSIGALRAPYPNHVVACSGTKLWMLNYRGAIASGFPWTFSGQFRAPAAIGDVDEDGKNEIVSLKDGWVHINSPWSPTPKAYRRMPGVVFSGPPSLGDITFTGPRQIAAPTSTGTVYILNNILSDFAGWPYTDPDGFPASPIALGNTIGSFELDVAFATQRATVHHFWWDGTEVSGWPYSTQSGWWILGSPIIERTDAGSADILVGSRDGLGYNWDNMFTTNPEWPKDLGGRCEVAPAAGDIDNDGRMEVVFLTLTSIAIVDVGDYESPWDHERGRWPMYMNDPQRSGCADCDVQLVTAAPTVTSIVFEPPAPNPSVGSTTLRYSLVEPSEVHLDLYDARGRKVRALRHDRQEPGWQWARWDGRDDRGQVVASGAYFARLQVEDSRHSTTLVQRVLLVH